MKLSTVFGGIVAVICFFFAVIFAMAAGSAAVVDYPQLVQTRLITSGILFLIGIVVIAGVWYINRRPKTVVQHLEVSGRMSAAQIKCPHCGGSINADQIQITQGVPYVKCPYCGTTFEVTEEPKW
jgi:predicted Zn finger-like uncharacterized protein